MAVSSNKVLGLFGQEQSIPAVGFSMSQKTNVLTDTIVIVVSHSGTNDRTAGSLDTFCYSIMHLIFCSFSEHIFQHRWDIRSASMQQPTAIYNQEHLCSH
jgi:hypothetical protein